MKWIQARGLIALVLATWILGVGGSVGSTFAGGGVALAQEPGAVRRIQRYGRTDRRTAQAIASRVHEMLVANGRRGGDRYDGVRQALGNAMFGGPGSTRAEYDQRLTQVIARLGRGLTEQSLTALFASGEGVALRCASLFNLPMASCDALVAAASQTQADFPYMAPDDGATLRNELTAGGVGRADADAIVRAMATTLLSVPGAADTSPRGRWLTSLLRACPGGIDDEEARVRAWHLGATPGMVRCIAREVGRQGRNAPRVFQQVFQLGAPSVALLRWAHGQSGATAAARPASGPDPSRNRLMSQAVAYYNAGQFAAAARVYQQVTTLEPGFSPAHQGLAVSRMRAGDAHGAVDAYRHAARLEPTNAAVQVGLARALTQSGDRQGAVHAYQMALTLEPHRQDARAELARVQGAVAPPTPAPPPVDPATQLRTQARGLFGARRFADAARAYGQLTRMQPSDASAWAGLGASQLAQRDAAGAVSSYRLAVQLEPGNAGFWAALGAAEATAGNADGARAAFERALTIDPNHAGARAGLARVGPPRPTLPEVPPRAEIVRTMAPFQARLEACAPTISGTVRFRMVIRGQDGNVRDVELLGSHAGTSEGECMVSHLRGARFPRFTRSELEVRYPFELEGAPAQAPVAEAPSDEAPPDEGDGPPNDHSDIADIAEGALGD